MSAEIVSRGFTSAPRRVMIVDDDGDSRKLLRAVLERDGALVVAEADSEDFAVPEAARTNPDVVVVDSRLDHRDSGPLLRRLRVLTPNIHLIAYSAMPAEAGAPAALAAGADLYLEKGSLPELCAAIRAGATGPGRVVAAPTPPAT